ncbi:MAG TPA: hypothetical protein VNC40_08335 [Gaiellaceae bacterium]|nr:hypothetical protein [Gaiellaceae bacterium]
MMKLRKILLTFTPLGAAAFVGGGGTFSSFGELAAWSRSSRREPVDARPSATAAAPRRHALRTTKRVCLALIAVEVATSLSVGGTFASFSAETSNNSGSIASGTLTMSDQVNAGTVCASVNGATQNNINAACDAVMALTNVAPGVYGGTAKITIQNTGSIDASKLYVYAPFANATLTGALTSGSPVTALTVGSLEGTVTNGDSLVVTYGTNTQTFIASGGTTGGATSISVTSQNANFSYPSGSHVSDSSSDTTASNTDCYDAKTTVPGTAGATAGTALNFNPVTGNPFCATALMYIQETTGGLNYCWSGKGSSPENSVGMCTAPISVTLSGGLSGTVTSLPVAALNGNVASGDSVLVTSGANTQTFTAAANAFFGATSITVNSVAANYAYPIGSTVSDTTTLTSLNSDTTDTISNFDTGHPVSGRIQLYPVTANGTVNNAATVQLSHYNTGTYQRTFQVGLYMPAPAGINQNPLQGLSSTFGLKWHIDQ